MKELGRCGRLSAAGEVWPQTGLAYLASVARQAGAEVQLLDAMALDWSPSRTAQAVKGFKPDAIFVHLTTPTFNNDKEFCKALKQGLPSAVFVVVGSHASALPEEVLRDFPTDYALVREGETPVQALAELGGFIRESLPPGFRWLDDDGVMQSSGDSGMIADLDSLPHPARDLLPNTRYKMPFFGREPFATVISSRGCPYGCTFCRAGVSWGKKVRARTVSNVVEEILLLRHKFHIRNVVFMTDSFTFDRDWVLETCAAMEDSRVRWICNSRVDAVDEEMLHSMKRAGCLLISYGLESGSQELLKSCRKNITLEQSREAIKLTRQAGITSFGYFIFGLPGETWDTVHQTIDFALDVGPDYALFHVATPFPGTRLFEEAKEKGLLLEMDWALCDEESVGIMRTESLSPDDLRKARQLAIRRFYLRPQRIMKELAQMRSLESLLARGKAAAKVLTTWLNTTHRCEVKVQ